MRGNLAALDCGSLSTRLLVARPDGSELARLTRVTALAEGVDRTGALGEAAMERVLAVLREYRAVMQAHGVTVAAMVGTSALRDAANRVLFSERAGAVVGCPLRLLTGEQEAELCFRGATAALGAPAPAGSPYAGGTGAPQPEGVQGARGGPWLVVDIGGGSTELAVGPVPFGARSLDLGCVRVTERFLSDDPPSGPQVAAARAWVSEQLVRARREIPLGQAKRLVGVAGTVAALACFDRGLAVYDRLAVHHYSLGLGAVEGALSHLAAQQALERARQPGVGAARAPWVVAGALVLATVMVDLGFEECLVSEADLLDGLVESLAASVGSGAAG